VEVTPKLFDGLLDLSVLGGEKERLDLDYFVQL